MGQSLPPAVTASPVLMRRISGKTFIGHFLIADTVALLVTAILVVFQQMSAVWMVIGGAVLVNLILMGGMQIALRSSVYTLYGDRMEVESGILSRRIENIDLFRVRDVGLHQSILGRLLNYGDLYILSTDSSAPQLQIRGIDNPRGFYQIIRERVGARANPALERVLNLGK